MPKEEGFKNLIPFSELSEEEHRKIASNGGKKSVIARRKKKTMAEIAKYQIYEMELPDALKKNLKEQGIDPDNLNHANVMVRSMMAKAESGDVQAYNTLLSLIGEKPTDKTEADINMSMKVEYVKAGHGIAYSEDEIDESK